MKINKCPICSSLDVVMLSKSEIIPDGTVQKISAGVKCCTCSCNIELHSYPDLTHQIHAVLAKESKELLNSVIVRWNGDRS